MANQIISVVIKDKHSVNLHDIARNGNLIKNVFITDGEILGSPAVSGDLCTITCLEHGRTTIRTYKLPNFTFTNMYHIN